MRFSLLILGILSAIAAFAQPSAPIEWGEIELLYDLPLDYGVDNIAARGDTIVLTAITPYPINNQSVPAVAVSSDDGQTWSEWTALTTPTVRNYWSQPVITSSGLFVCHETAQDWHGFSQTTDLGESWVAPRALQYHLWPLAQRDDTVFLRELGNGVTWTADGGESYAPIRASGFVGEDFGIDDMAVGAGYLHCVGVTRLDAGHWPRLSYTRGPTTDGPFEPVRELASDIYFPVHCSIDMDERGYGVILLSAALDPPALFPIAVLAYQTTDGGASWQGPDTLSNYESAGLGFTQVVHDRSFWISVWYDSTRQGDFSLGGYWCRFSANGGRDWYPKQQIEGDSISIGGLKAVEIADHRIRVYVAFQAWHSPQGRLSHCYFRWEGTIRVDSLPPVIETVAYLDTLLIGGETVSLEAVAHDNDSLWLAEVVICRAESADSQVVPLVRNLPQDSLYRGEWLVPVDTADYLYYYRFEDMWENVTFMPPEGPADPWRFHVGPLSSEVDRNLAPAFFGLSVFPNPFNSTAIFSFTLPEPSPVTLRVFNLLGQEIHAADLGQLSFGEHRHIFHARDLPSGLYFTRVETASIVMTKKVVLLR